MERTSTCRRERVAGRMGSGIVRTRCIAVWFPSAAVNLRMCMPRGSTASTQACWSARVAIVAQLRNILDCNVGELAPCSPKHFTPVDVRSVDVLSDIGLSCRRPAELVLRVQRSRNFRHVVVALSYVRFTCGPCSADSGKRDVPQKLIDWCVSHPAQLPVLGSVSPSRSHVGADYLHPGDNPGRLRVHLALDARMRVRQRAKNLPRQARTGWTGRHRLDMRTSLTGTYGTQ